MNVLVAGGAGFLGSHLVDLLVAQGHTVVIADNLITGQLRNLSAYSEHPQVSMVNADVSVKSNIEQIPGTFDRIYHLASPASPVDYTTFPLQTLAVNSQGTWNLLDRAAVDGARFLITSTSEIYGEPQVHPQPESYWGNVNSIGPRSCYDEGKRFAESLCMTYSQQCGVDVRIARLFNTYGPRIKSNDGRVVPNFISQILKGDPVTIYGSGEQTRSLCYVSDTVGGINRLMEVEGLNREAVNIGNPDEYTMIELANEIMAAIGRTSELVFRPLPVDDPSRRQPDVSKASRLLEWQPTVSLSEGLRQTVEYFRLTSE